MECTKKAFTDFQEARKLLNVIKADPRYKGKEKQEKRIYTCPFCGKYHITSISHKQNIIYHKEMQNKQKSRIAKIADYWEKKLGIKKEN